MNAPTPFFDRLLHAARAQVEPQRLLFVFALSDLPDGASPAQRARHEAGRGGALSPIACVDKSPGDLASFEALVTESALACPPWQAVFIAALAGEGTAAPAPARVDAALDVMVDNIQAGRFQGYMVLDPRGVPLQIQRETTA
jgi:hypothetical protein